MANEFTTGLLQGFNFVDSIRQRRRQTELEAERLTIARAAEGRAQSAETRLQTNFERDAADRETIIAGREAAFNIGETGRNASAPANGPAANGSQPHPVGASGAAFHKC